MILKNSRYERYEERLNETLRKNVESSRIEVKVNNRHGEIENNEYTDTIKLFSFGMNFVLVIISLIIVFTVYRNGASTNRLLWTTSILFGALLFKLLEYIYTF